MAEVVEEEKKRAVGLRLQLNSLIKKGKDDQRRFMVIESENLVESYKKNTYTKNVLILLLDFYGRTSLGVRTYTPGSGNSWKSRNSSARNFRSISNVSLN